MADAFDPTNPRHLTAEQRLDELTAILATAVQRALALRARSIAPESEQIRLDVSPQTSVHVPVELTQPENGEGVEA